MSEPSLGFACFETPHPAGAGAAIASPSPPADAAEPHTGASPAGNPDDRTNAEKRAAVVAAFDDPALAAWSSRAIAAHCEVGPSLVNDVRRSLPESVAPRVYRTRHGTVA